MVTIELRISFPKFIIWIHLLEKFGSQRFITNIEISQITRHSCNRTSLEIWKDTRNVAIQNRELNNVKIKIFAFVIYLRWNAPFEIDKRKSKNEASVSVELDLFNCSSPLNEWQFLKSKDCQYSEGRPNIWNWVKRLNNISFCTIRKTHNKTTKIPTKETRLVLIGISKICQCYLVPNLIKCYLKGMIMHYIRFHKTNV